MDDLKLYALNAIDFYFGLHEVVVISNRNIIIKLCYYVIRSTKEYNNKTVLLRDTIH